MGRESGTTPDEAKTRKDSPAYLSYPNRYAVSPAEAARIKAGWRATYSVWREKQPLDLLASYIATFCEDVANRLKASL